jgi:hypothetical protein
MLRLLPVLLLIGLTVYALIDCLSTERAQVRNLPRIAWVFVILVFPLIGSLAWLFAGRPVQTAVPDAARRTTSTPARRPLAPDDDPEFLRKLSRERRDDEELLRRWEADLRRREEEMRKREHPDEPPEEE